MVKPNTQSDQDKCTEFTPTKKIFFGVGNSAYNAVLAIKEEKSKQKFLNQLLHDIPNAKQDVLDMARHLKMYNFHFEEDGGQD